MDQKTLEKQTVDLAAQVRGLMKAMQVLQQQITQLKQENRHIKARQEAMGHNVARLMQKD